MTTESAAAPAPLLLIINRFDDEFGAYHRFLPPGTFRLAYLTTPDAVAPLDTASAAATAVVPDLDLATLLPAARRIAEEHGPVAAVAGLSEFDLVTAARLREELDVPGWRSEYVLRFRDKTRMKRWVTAAGVRAPRYAALDETWTAERLVAEFGLPLILKPRDGATSRGVVLARTARQVEAGLAGVTDRSGYEAEEYVEGDIVHVDGVRRGGAFHFVSVSQYENTCLEFTRGVPLGSVLLDPGPRRDLLTGFAADALDALELWDGPFHLEVIVDPAGEPVFLEVGLRPGGAGVPFVHRDLFGVNLYAEGLRAVLGLPPVTPAEQYPRLADGGGWLVFPEPRPWPRQVTGRTSLLGVVPEVYAEALPPLGHVFDGEGGYDHAGGRFLLRGADEAAVRRAVHTAIGRYRLETGAPVAATA